MSEKNMNLGEKIEGLIELEKLQKDSLKLQIEKKLIEMSINEDELNDSYTEVMKCENPKELEKIMKKIKELKKHKQNFHNEIMEAVKESLEKITAFQMLVAELHSFFFEEKNKELMSNLKEKKHEKK